MNLRVLATALVGLSLASATTALAQAPAAAQAQATTPHDFIIAEIRLNGVETGEVGEFHAQPDGSYAVSPDILRSVGLSIHSADREVNLARIEGLTFAFDQETQTMDLAAEPRILQATAFNASRYAIRPPDAASPGALLNYATNIVAGNGSVDASAYGELRLFRGSTVATSTFLMQTGDRADFARLETALRFVNHEKARRLVLGDFISSGLSWTRPVRAGGVSLASDFAMRPDIITQPLAKVSGTAAATSTVELFIDGVSQFAAETPAGPFSINQPPMVSGKGDVNLVVTDATGRQTVQSFAFYAAEDLYRQGLSAFAIDAGFTRIGFSGDNDHYADPFVSGSFQYGFSDQVTLQAHAEFADGLQQIGGGLVANLANQALVSAAVSLSSSRDGAGGQLHLGARREALSLNLFANVDIGFGHYADVASLEGDGAVSRRIQLGVAKATERFGAFGANYTAIKTDTSDRGVVTATWSRGVFDRASLYLTAFAVTGQHESGLSLGLSMPLGERRAVGATVNADQDGQDYQAYVTQSPTENGGIGWRAEGRSAAGGSGQAEIFKVDGSGEHGLGASYADNTFTGRAYSSGAVVFMGGKPRLAPQVSGGLILVETGFPNIGIRFQNREVGVTGVDGRLLLTQILPYVPGRLDIVPETVPLEVDIVSPRVEVTPPGNAGMVAFLPLVVNRAVSLTIQASDGRALPPGSPVFVNNEEVGVMGYDGSVYLSTLKAANHIQVIGTWGACVVDFERPDVPLVTRKLVCEVQQ